jgi:hypothetical protein
MKQMVIMGLICLTVATCSSCSSKAQPGATMASANTSSSAEIVSSSNTAAKDAAKKYIADVKERLQKTQKPEYFQSAEWKAFVDSFWQGYNKAQQQSKDPQLMSSSEITY